jgi:very-short-patch-repair endonuclease
MRVSTAEVYGNVDGVLDTIWATLQEQTSGRGLDTPT